MADIRNKYYLKSLNVERRLLRLTGLEELLTGGRRRVPGLTEALVRELSEGETGVGVDVGMPGTLY